MPLRHFLTCLDSDEYQTLGFLMFPHQDHVWFIGCVFNTPCPTCAFSMLWSCIAHCHLLPTPMQPLSCVKLWFTNMYFVGFYSVPNLIVILFNLMYPVFVMEVYCKGCVIVKESVKTQAIKARRVFMGISWLSIPRKEACVLHMTGMQRVSTNRDSCVLRVARG